MNTLSAKTIALYRTNYGESDRIVTFITQEGIKITLLTKGVRKIKSRLAGGIELFCVSDLVYIDGKKKIGTLISSRVDKNYSNIVKDINRTMFGYDVLKLINRVTEDEQLTEYYDFLNITLESLNNLELDLDLVKTWVYFKVLDYSGHAPNVDTDMEGKRLLEGKSYDIDYSSMTFVQSNHGMINTNQIKLLRTMPKIGSPEKLVLINNIEQINKDLFSVLTKMINYNL